MNSLEYLNENGLKKYPFVDGATLAPTNGIQIPSDLLVDAGLYPSASNIRIWLVAMQQTALNISFTFKWVKPDASNGTYPAVVITLSSIEQLLRTTFSVAGLSGFLTFGAGVVGLPVNVYTFTDDSNFIVDSRILPISPKITTITVANFDLGGATTAIASSTTDFTIKEGSNTQFLPQTGGEQLSVVPGVGTGLFDPCGGDLVVRTVNGVPTTSGSFIFATDACQRLVPSAHSLFIENLCTAGCSAQLIEDSAYYINRVNNGLTQMGNLIKNLRDNLAAEINNYNSVTVPARETPYAIPTLARYGNGKPSSGTQANYTYFTMRMYVYNPSTTPVVVTAAGTTGAGSTLVSIAYLDKDGTPIATTIPGSPPSFCAGASTPCESFSVGCRAFVVVKLTVRVFNPAFGGIDSTVKIDTTIGSKTYNIKSGP